MLALATLAPWPSPNCQNLLLILPVEISINSTVSGAKPITGVAVKSVIGGSVVVVVVVVVVLLLPPPPPLFIVVLVTGPDLFRVPG